ncbi:hypothetical protein JTB14_030254 [Gonioctena quinquepunctata]|nr:hypothetical protein JTB14_030254 [Gonioctena quinquepunctata]
MSSPYKSALETEVQERNEKVNKLKRNLSKTHKKPMHEVKPPEGQKAKKTKLEEPVLLSSSEEEQDTETCMFCNELYLHSKAEDGWIQCSGCHGWAHEAFSNAEEDDTFICDFCA